MNMGVRLSISIMAHSSRESFFPYLREKLGDVPFSIDKPGPENIGVWPNCRRAWGMFSSSATHHVVIQDDAIVCEQFRERAESLIGRTAERNCAYQFYVGKKRALEDEMQIERGDDLILHQTLWWGVAICLPVTMIGPMIEYADGLNLPQDDMRIRAFLKSRSIKICYPMPCLIDHRHGPSLVGDPGTQRSSKNFIGYENK